jgi:hypothetical protein
VIVDPETRTAAAAPSALMPVVPFWSTTESLTKTRVVPPVEVAEIPLSLFPVIVLFFTTTRKPGAVVALVPFAKSPTSLPYRLPLGMEEVAHPAREVTVPAERDDAFLFRDRGKIEMSPAALLDHMADEVIEMEPLHHDGIGSQIAAAGKLCRLTNQDCGGLAAPPLQQHRTYGSVDER